MSPQREQTFPDQRSSKLELLLMGLARTLERGASRLSLDAGPARAQAVASATGPDAIRATASHVFAMRHERYMQVLDGTGAVIDSFARSTEDVMYLGNVQHA